MAEINNQIIVGNNIITTPYEKVLSIINDAKKFINMMSKNQTKLIRDLEWVIKIITSHSLYTYELKDNELIKKYSNENQDFKQFVEFVSEYNEEVIEMNKKTDLINSKSFKMNNELLTIPSFKLKRKFNLKSSFNEGNSLKKKFSSNNLPRQQININYNNNGNDTNKLSVNSLKQMMKYNNNYISTSPNYYPMKKSLKKNHMNSHLNNLIKSTDLTFKSQNERINNLFKRKYNSPLKKDDVNSRSFNKIRPCSSEIKHNNSFIFIESLLSKANFDLRKIFDKEFNIFELKKIVGHANVLPIMGKLILEEFGLNNDKIIQTYKLESFLISVSNQYYTTVQYHNSIHGSDVTQTICLFFLNSNIEEVGQTKVLDLLSIFIAALGHDIAHPGLNNNFQINSSSDMAITYNDISCLENYHCAKLFKTIKVDENNIFEKLSETDYKLIRKRMISEILATDMVNHSKIMTVIQAKIPNELFENKDNNIIENKKFELLSKNPKTQFEEQQSLLDYLIHAADLAHNTKLFKISIHWVELLTNEFWLQGDKEKSMNLPVSFLCDRVGHDIPSSQVGFIKGFILPTFDILVTMFPTLNYTMENAKINLNEWQKLVEKHRLTGWTSRDKKENENDYLSSNNKKHFTANWGKPKLIIVKKPK